MLVQNHYLIRELLSLRLTGGGQEVVLQSVFMHLQVVYSPT